MSAKYKMTISRLTVDKLGVKLYDKVSAVIAELVANSYDADAREVSIIAPMGEYLATKKANVIHDSGFTISVIDNGIGMTPDEVNDFYLKVGAERRNDKRRGDTSKIYKRKVMGRKGVGKLAPFGICTKAEIITSGGKQITRKDKNGKEEKGYLTAHIILDSSDILDENDKPYNPEIGKYDDTIRQQCGTKIILSIFSRRQVPTMEAFERQLAQRFGIRTADWQIKLIDSTKSIGDSINCRVVGDFQVDTMDNTKIIFKTENSGSVTHHAYDPSGNILSDIKAGFDYEGEFYPLNGWIAYARNPYKDDLMAGVRIYCRGKIAAQTHVFNRKAGFTGEHSIRSYLVGELHADWLDKDEDLIQTDRRDILWSHDLGQAFEQWGQKAVLVIGKLSRDPMKKKIWDKFKEKSNLDAIVNEAFPGAEQEGLRQSAKELAKLMGQKIREEEVEDESAVKSIVQLSLNLAPHLTLGEQLREAATEGNTPFEVFTKILKTARIAELSSFGQIAEERVKVIEKLNTLKNDKDADESEYQKLISDAPWLINPQWSPITSNQTFSTLKEEFQKYYKEKTGHEIFLDDFSQSSKRPDFVLLNHDGIIEVVEIKKPHHDLSNDEMIRIDTYYQQMNSFLSEPSNKTFADSFKSGFHITLVCDGIKLSGVSKTAFEGLVEKKCLKHINWRSFLLKTKNMHEDFLNEAQRQRKMLTK